MVTFTVLYTQNLRGELARLPRVATVLRRLRSAAVGEVLLLDAGNACAAGVELCDLTEGRAAPIVLDAVGYDAVNVTGILSEAGRASLADNYLNVALVDEAHPFVWREAVAYAVAPPAALPHDFHIALATSDATALSPEPTLNRIYTLTLATVAAGRLARWPCGYRLTACRNWCEWRSMTCPRVRRRMRPSAGRWILWGMRCGI